MTTGNIYTGSLADSLEYTIASARNTREIGGVMANAKAIDLITLGTGKGLTWNEITVSQLTAQLVGEQEKLDNPQQVSDTVFSVTPTVIGIHTFITDRVKARISPKTFARIGKLGQDAIQRKKEQDLALFLDGASTSLCGAGTTMAAGYVMAGAAQIKGNSTEPGTEPLIAALHSYQLKAIEDEILAGVGTLVLGPGMTQETYQNGYRGKIAGVTILEDNHITIDSSSDAKGGVWAHDAIVMVQGRTPWKETRREPDIGGGGDSVWLYDEYAIGERSSGNWAKELYSDATAPTS